MAFLENKNPWQRKSTKTIYQNPWIRLEHEEVIDPGGQEGIYGVVHFKNIAVGIIPVDEEGYTYLVGQYRYPLKQYSWEIPEGGCPLGADILQAAKRELVEETGIEAKEWEQIQHLHTSNSVSDECAYIFLARSLKFGESKPETTEELQIKKIKIEEAIEMVLKGEITDAMSVAGLLLINAQKKQRGL